MHDLVDALQGLEQRGLVADIADHHIDVGIEPVRALARPVDLLDHAVENAHPMPLVEERTRHVTANKASATGDEDRIRQRMSLQIFFRRYARPTSGIWFVTDLRGS